MYTMCKDGVIRIVATEAEAARWESLGYKKVAAAEEVPKTHIEKGGKKSMSEG